MLIQTTRLDGGHTQDQLCFHTNDLGISTPLLETIISEEDGFANDF